MSEPPKLSMSKQQNRTSELAKNDARTVENYVKLLKIENGVKIHENDSKINENKVITVKNAFKTVNLSQNYQK